MYYYLNHHNQFHNKIHHYQYLFHFFFIFLSLSSWQKLSQYMVLIEIISILSGKVVVSKFHIGYGRTYVNQSGIWVGWSAQINFVIVVNFVQNELSLLSLTLQNSPHVYNQSRSDPGFICHRCFCLSALYTCLSTAIYTLRAHSQTKQLLGDPNSD